VPFSGTCATREDHDWEVEAFTTFFRVLYIAKVRREGEDKLWWVSSKKGLFGGKSFYSVMGYHDGVRFLGKFLAY
jgi:hypothetical protein